MLAGTGAVQWGDVATWIASAGTVGALFAALIQLSRERQARTAQEGRNRELAQHDRELAASDRDERHHYHARLISAWTAAAERVPGEERIVDTPTELDWHFNFKTPIYIHNSSMEPVYELVIGLVFVQGTGSHTLEGIIRHFRERLEDAQERAARENRMPTTQDTYAGIGPVTTMSILPPGTWRAWIQGSGWGSILSGRLGVDIAFKDRAGIGWIRRATGQLEELDVAPFDYFRKHGLYGPYALVPPEPVSRSAGSAGT